MDLSIVNFRCYFKAPVYKFRFDNGLTHLVGNSGNGKSTLSLAIEWCLYGKGSFKPKVKVSEATEVTLKFRNFDNVKIKRKSPNYITVYLEDKTLESDAAQGWINNKFGSNNLWRSSSLLSQGERNIILIGTGEEKLKILQELTYGSELDDLNDPEWYLNTLKSKMKEQDKVCSTLNIKYDTMFSRLEPIVNNSTNDWDPDKESLSRIKRKIEEVKKDVSKSKDLWSHYSYQLKQKVDLEEKIKNLPTISENLDSLKLKLKEKEKLYQECLENRDILKKKEKILEYQPYTINNKLYIDLYNRDSKRKSYIKQCDKYNIPDTYRDSLPDLNKKLEDISKYLAEKSLFNSYKKRNAERLEVIDKISKLKSDKTLDLEMLEQLEFETTVKIKDIKSKLGNFNRVVCPSCKEVLMIRQDIVLEEEQLKLLKAEKESLEDLLVSTNEDLSMAQQIYNLEKRLVNMVEEPEINEPEIIDISLLEEIGTTDVNKLLMALNNVFDYEPPFEEKETLKLLTNGEKLKDLGTPEQLEEWAKMEILPCNLNDIKNEMDNIREKISFINSINTKYELLSKQKSELSNITEPNIEESHVFQENLDSYLKRQSLGEEFERLQKELDIMYDVKDELDNNIETLKKMESLYDLIKKVSISPIEDIIQSINYTLNHILEELFESPINVNLSLYKSNGKMSVNFQINYGEEVYSSISNLSGGEADRVSLALTIAFAKIHYSPILFLDECMASLNSEHREKCLKVIKENLSIRSEKCVFDVCHESVEGYHDNIVPVNKDFL